MTPNKSDLRIEAKSRRKGRASTEPSLDLLSFLSTEIPVGSRIGCYLSKTGELDTTKLIDLLQDKYELYAPAVVDDQIVWRKLDEKVKLGKFGIIEPTSSHTISPDDFSCVLIPALAVDSFGNRLGYGAGYFDRNLRDIKAIKIALVFDSDVVAEIPAEHHDVRVNYIATQSRLIKTKD